MCSIYSFVFKNKTLQNRNDEKHKQAGINVKVLTNTTVSDRAKVHRGYLITAISGHRIEASLGTTPDALRVNN